MRQKNSDLYLIIIVKLKWFLIAVSSVCWSAAQFSLLQQLCSEWDCREMSGEDRKSPHGLEITHLPWRQHSHWRRERKLDGLVFASISVWLLICECVLVAVCLWEDHWEFQNMFQWSSLWVRASGDSFKLLGIAIMVFFKIKAGN